MCCGGALYDSSAYVCCGGRAFERSIQPLCCATTSNQSCEFGPDKSTSDWGALSCAGPVMAVYNGLDTQYTGVL